MWLVYEFFLDGVNGYETGRQTFGHSTEVHPIVLQVLILQYNLFIPLSLRNVKMKLLNNRQSLTKYLNYSSDEIRPLISDKQESFPK